MQHQPPHRVGSCVGRGPDPAKHGAQAQGPPKVRVQVPTACLRVSCLSRLSCLQLCRAAAAIPRCLSARRRRLGAAPQPGNAAAAHRGGGGRAGGAAGGRPHRRCPGKLISAIYILLRRRIPGTHWCWHSADYRMLEGKGAGAPHRMRRRLRVAGTCCCCWRWRWWQLSLRSSRQRGTPFAFPLPPNAPWSRGRQQPGAPSSAALEGGLAQAPTCSTSLPASRLAQRAVPCCARFPRRACFPHRACRGAALWHQSIRCVPSRQCKRRSSSERVQAVACCGRWSGCSKRCSTAVDSRGGSAAGTLLRTYMA